jgi:hypothetical protein
MENWHQTDQDGRVAETAYKKRNDGDERGKTQRKSEKDAIKNIDNIVMPKDSS